MKRLSPRLVKIRICCGGDVNDDDDDGDYDDCYGGFPIPLRTICKLPFISGHDAPHSCDARSHPVNYDSSSTLKQHEMTDHDIVTQQMRFWSQWLRLPEAVRRPSPTNEHQSTDTTHADTC